MTDAAKWNDYYQRGEVPWDTGQPSVELKRVLAARSIKPCRALEIGCGSGTNSFWLAQQGFDVTAIDVAPLAIAQAVSQASARGVAARFLAADILKPVDLGPSFEFFFDRGCYHAVRREHPHEYAPAVARLLGPGAFGLVLCGNAREKHDYGPPVVTEEEIRDELGGTFKIIDLHEFYFDTVVDFGGPFLAWSCWLEK